MKNIVFTFLLVALIILVVDDIIESKLSIRDLITTMQIEVNTAKSRLETIEQGCF